MDGIGGGGTPRWRFMGNTSSLYAFLQKRPEGTEMISNGRHSHGLETYMQTERFGFFNVESGGGN